MRVRKSLAAGAAVLTAGLLSLNPIAQATTPHGPIAGVTVNGISTTGTIPINGVYKSGTIVSPGFTASCDAGSTIAGTVDRGPNTAPKFRFSSLGLTCDSPLGIPATWSLDTGKPGCSTFEATLADSRVHTGNAPGDLDTGTPTGDPGNVTGAGTINSKCILVTHPGGCNYRVDGTFGLQFNEAVATHNGVDYQEIVLTGYGLRARDSHALCFGLIPERQCPQAERPHLQGAGHRRHHHRH